MKISNIMSTMASRLDNISGLTVYAFPSDQAYPPCAVIGWPEEYTYDATYGRGSDRLTLPVFVLVGKMADRSVRDTLSAYVDGSGAKSVKATLESSTWASMDVARVVSVEFSEVSVAGVEYMAGIFSVDIFGDGST